MISPLFCPARRGLRVPLSLLLCSALAACGGGGGSTDVTRDPTLPAPSTPDNEAPRTVNGLRSAATDLLDDWAPGDVAAYTALSAVPTTGGAAYSGFLFGDLSDDGTATDSLIGRLTLEVDFTASSATFDGSATDFIDSRDDPLSGTLRVSGGSLNRDGNPANDATLRGISVAGTLREGDGTTLDVGVQLEGDFLGVGAEAVGGEAIGRVTVGTTSQDFDGGFIAAE